MFKMKMIIVALLSVTAAAIPGLGERCQGSPQERKENLLNDAAIAQKLQEIELLKQKVERLRKVALPKAFARLSKADRERIEELQKEIDDYNRKVKGATKGTQKEGESTVRKDNAISMQRNDPPPNLEDSAPLLTPERFEKWNKLIKPAPGEARWEEIPWLLSVYDARKKAAEEGKPIFLWSGGGGPPIGGC